MHYNFKDKLGPIPMASHDIYLSVSSTTLNTHTHTQHTCPIPLQHRHPQSHPHLQPQPHPHIHPHIRAQPLQCQRARLRPHLHRSYLVPVSFALVRPCCCSLADCDFFCVHFNNLPFCISARRDKGRSVRGQLQAVLQGGSDHHFRLHQLLHQPPTRVRLCLHWWGELPGPDWPAGVRQRPQDGPHPRARALSDAAGY